MSKMGKGVWVGWVVTAAFFVLGLAPTSWAGPMLSGAALDSGCRAYADQAVKNSKEWERRDCGKKLNLGVQLMDTDYNWQLNRCLRSVGTSIDTDLQEQEKYLKQCPQDVIGGTGVVPPAGTYPPPTPPPVTQPPQPRPPTPVHPPAVPSGKASAGPAWDLIVIESVTLGRSQQTYRIPSPIEGAFKGVNVAAGNPDFEGEYSAPAFRAVMTDPTGYRADFFGRKTESGKFEGTGCDNRGRSFSFKLVKQ